MWSFLPIDLFEKGLDRKLLYTFLNNFLAESFHSLKLPSINEALKDYAE